MKIKTVTLNNFRGFPSFPGSPAQTFDFGGKNLLVYGENGAGKSSLFHALKTFFTLKHPNYTGEACNIFSDSDEHSIKVEFDDGHFALWEGPPKPSNWTSDKVVERASEIRGCLDYRDLLNTNYIHGKNDINLFDVAVNVLLANFSVDISGGDTAATAKVPTVTIAALWQNIERASHILRIEARRTETLKACTAFNNGFRKALAKIESQTINLLKVLPAEGMELKEFEFSGVTYNHEKRIVEGDELKPIISLYGKAIPQPQNFLNEARLSALGIAIYLAGILSCIPERDAPDSSNDYLKLLVLDDVLIGLDLSNRLPLLDLLRDYFADWQIVLLTHDLVWFETARISIKNKETEDRENKDKDAWHTIEIYEGKRAKTNIVTATEDYIPCPLVHDATGCDLAQSLLDKAGKFLRTGYLPAAVNYTRSAFEVTLKVFCDRFKVPVEYALEAKKVDTQMYIGSIIRWTEKKPEYAHFKGKIERVLLFRAIVLNPMSHSLPWTIVKAEVEGAIRAVESLLALNKEQTSDVSNPLSMLKLARGILASAVPTTSEQQEALGYMRSAFIRGLKEFSKTKKILVAYEGSDSPISLWKQIAKNHRDIQSAIEDYLAKYSSNVAEVETFLILKPDINQLTKDKLEHLLTLIQPDKDHTLFDIIIAQLKANA